MLKRKSYGSKSGRAKKRYKPSYLRTAYGGGPMGGGKGRRYTTQAIIRSPSNAPDRMFIKLKTGLKTQYITGAAGAFATGYIRANSAFDPLGTLGAVTPTGSTPLLGASGSAVYGAYIVHACAIRIDGIQTTNTGSAVIAVTPRVGSAAAPTSIAKQVAMPRTRWMMTGASANNQTNTIRMFHTTAQCYGQSPQTVAIADSFSALYNANPGSEVQWDISIEATDSTQQTVNLVMVMTQWVEIFGRWTEA